MTETTLGSVDVGDGFTDPMVRPSLVHEGLAVYAFGSGEPVLLMPYPHAATVAGGRTLTRLVEGLEALGRQVLTFDPPGAGRSTRSMRLDMSEMLGCAEEALTVYGLERGPVDIMGHSHGGFAALAFAVERPELARRLDYRPRLGEVRAPTLLAVGRHNPQMSPACSEELAASIPAARLVVFEESGHYPFIEEPGEFWAEVRAFLDAL